MEIAVITILAAFFGSIFYTVIRLIWRLRNDDVEAGHRWSDIVSRDRSKREKPGDF